MYIYQKLDAAVQPVLRGTQRSTRLGNPAKRGRVLEAVTDQGPTTRVWELTRWNCPSRLVKTPREIQMIAILRAPPRRRGDAEGTTPAFLCLAELLMVYM